MTILKYISYEKTILLSILLLSYFTGKAQLPDYLKGNWINNTTNHWEYGFFEEFVIYQYEFWDYEDIITKENKTLLMIRQGDRSVKLEIEANKKDNSLHIKNGKQKVQNYEYSEKVYPQYSYKDTIAFPEPRFQQDSTTIIGYYQYFEKIPDPYKTQFGKNSFEVSVPDFIAGSSIQYTTSIDSTGRFSLTFPIVGYQEVWTDWGRLNEILIVAPQDTLFLYADMNDLLPLENEGQSHWLNRPKKINFMGNNSRLNNEIVGYKSKDVYFDLREESKKGTSDMEILRKQERVYKKQMQHLNDYIQNYPTLSEKFIYYQKESNLYRHASYLMQHSFNIREREIPEFEEGYITYINENIPFYNPKAYTLIRGYERFIRDYIGYASPRSRNTLITLEMATNYLREKGLITPQIEELEKKSNQLIDRYKQLYEEKVQDTIQQQELMLALNELSSEINSNELYTYAQEALLSEHLLSQELATTDSIITDPILKELCTAKIYYKNLETNRLPLSEGDMKVFNKQIQMPFLKERLLAMNEYYARIKEQTMDETSSLKNTDHLEDEYDADKLFNYLTEPYRGKVIYLDMWGTWCKSCRENMKLMVDVKEQLKDKDIIFMYMANNSPVQTWESVIKEMTLTGENVVHYCLPDKQQKILEKKLNISFFPTYMIIDKEGNIVNTKAPSPKEIPDLLNELSKYY